MSSITNLQLVAAFQRYVKDRWGYVYGAQGEQYTKELAQQWQDKGRSVPSGRSKKTYFTGDCAKWYGHRIADCSGGIVYTIQQYNKSFKDRTANGFKSQFTEGGTISTIPEIPGLAVWRSGHIGVYEGNGYVLEFRGTDYGCVRTKLSARNFTHWGKISGVTYVSSSQPVSPAPSPSTSISGRRVKVLGKSVNVRQAPTTSAPVIGVAHQNDEYKTADNNWHYISFNGKYGWISGREDLTKIINS